MRISTEKNINICKYHTQIQRMYTKDNPEKTERHINHTCRIQSSKYHIILLHFSLYRKAEHMLNIPFLRSHNYHITCKMHDLSPDFFILSIVFFFFVYLEGDTFYFPVSVYLIRSAHYM